MNIVEMYDLVKNIYEENEDKYTFIGLRFENKVREIGEVCERSRHNGDREDERDFPEYGTEEYEQMEELGGTSAWDMTPTGYGYHPGMHSLRRVDLSKDCREFFLADHCYVIAGDYKGRHDCPDDGEIVIKDAVVIAQIF
ncbi:hypothetical protein [Brevibacillus composti]|uniref:Uncharacterized protein n=1 Tax=Brevibacillus composti TaxID=2796470 RepID=A0A7T5EM99_9BACL|nr:hypothetical protein [Brevibacillus composti]QQE75236.1 hypothetical protein JD108_04710 [Brevibacillus composti]